MNTKILSFYGPPGCGKGTIAQKCVKERGFKMLSTGDLLRQHIQEQSTLGKSLAEFVNKGQLIPDDLITQMVLEWLNKNMAPDRTIILDGFPRTSGQADLFLQSKIDFKVINFDLSEAEIVKRISSRLVCSNKKCQEVYSTLVKMPRKPGICDVCSSPILRRPDDEAEVVRERLNVFAKSRNDLLSFYKKSGVNVVNFSIPSGDPETVYKAFLRLL